MINFFKNTISSGGILVVALTISNLFNFAFNALLGRALTLEEFSLIAVINTLWFIISLFLNSLASTTNNRTAYLSSRRDYEVALSFRSYFSQKGFQISIILSILWLISIPIWMYLFHTNNYLLFLSITPAISLSIFTAILRGSLQGLFSFSKVAVLLVVESISKLIIAGLLIFLNLSTMAYLAIPLSVLITFVLAYFYLTERPKLQPTYRHLFPQKLLFASFLTTFSSISFLSIDLLLARYFLSDIESGAYSLLSLVGKMIFFVGSALGIFILTIASRDTGLNTNSSRNFYKLLAANIVILVLAFLVLATFAPVLIPILFGPKGQAILPYITPYAFGMVLFSISYCFAIYHLAKQQFAFAYNGLFAICLLGLGLFFFHSNIYDLIGVIVLVSTINFCLNLLLHVFYKDISDYLDAEDKRTFTEFSQDIPNRLKVSICVPAYNEGKNIGKLLLALRRQKTKLIEINKIVVVSSLSTDKTDKIAGFFTKLDSRFQLIRESQRSGKASAINKFLKITADPVVVIQSADTLPQKDTIEKLCRPFLVDKSIGMTGGAPIPVNNPNCFLGFVVHTWWWFHRNIPRFGEIIAFRNIINEVSPRTAVDEAYIQAKFAQLGYKVVHIDEAVVFNKGSENIKDIIKQRRRIYNGHTRLKQEENIRITNLSKSGLNLLIFEYKLFNIKQLIWLIGGILIEVWANILGRYDMYINKVNPVSWEIASSTKNLNIGKRFQQK